MIMRREILYGTLLLGIVVAGCLEKRLRSAKPAFAVAKNAQAIYREWGCGTCHGADCAGSATGPALRGLAAHWQSEALQRYLQNPAPLRSRDERLQKLSQRFVPVVMPAFDGVDSTQIAILADYLLKP